MPKQHRRTKPSAEELQLRERADALVTDSSSVRGRDGTVIKLDADELARLLEHTELTEPGRKHIEAQLKEVNEALAFERNTGRVLQIVLLLVMVLPAMLTWCGTLYEFALRPAMDVRPVQLHMHQVVLTGGCGSLGAELAIMLAESGARVVAGCHADPGPAEAEAEARFARLGLLEGAEAEGRDAVQLERANPDRGSIEVWPLELERFSAVRRFAGRVVDELGAVDLLIHAAASLDGCKNTEDGHEWNMQVNHLAPFLLTQLLLPTLRSGGRGRVVAVTCQAALVQPDWLPWPLTRTRLIPKAESAQTGDLSDRCDSDQQYADSKLVALLTSLELNRRLNHGFVNRGLAHTVDPGALANPFGRREPAPSARAAGRSSVMGYLPPVWLARKLYGLLFAGLGDYLLRDPTTGAKAVFHVATASELGQEQHGGGLYSDLAGSFVDCGLEAAQCGRVDEKSLPAAATDKQLAGRLWSWTEEAIGSRQLQSVVLEQGAQQPQEPAQPHEVSHTDL